MTTEKTIDRILPEISNATVREGDAIYYRAGEWTIGKDGCQPGNTACLLVATGAGDGCQVSDLEQWCPIDAAEAIEAWDAEYNA